MKDRMNSIRVNAMNQVNRLLAVDKLTESVDRACNHKHADQYIKPIQQVEKRMVTTLAIGLATSVVSGVTIGITMGLTAPSFALAAGSGLVIGAVTQRIANEQAITALDSISAELDMLVDLEDVKS